GPGARVLLHLAPRPAAPPADGGDRHDVRQPLTGDRGSGRPAAGATGPSGPAGHQGRKVVVPGSAIATQVRPGVSGISPPDSWKYWVGISREGFTHRALKACPSVSTRACPSPTSWASRMGTPNWSLTPLLP